MKDRLSMWLGSVVLAIAVCWGLGSTDQVIRVNGAETAWGQPTEVVAQPQSVLKSPVVAAPDTAAAMPAATKSFKATLIKAAETAQRKGEITRWELARIRLAVALRPAAVAEMQACCADEAVTAGKMMPSDASAAAFDWSQLLAFIQQLLPLILQIISIFS